MIKFSKLIFAFSFLILLASCGKDPVAAGDLEGTWTAESVVADIESTSNTVAGEITSTVTAEGSNLNYDLTLNGTEFTTSGGYDMTTEVDAGGIMIPSSTTMYSNISGSGTYSVSGDVMTIDGSFFEFDASGLTTMSSVGEQKATFEINADGKLVFSQDEEITTTDSGATVVSRVISTSVWVRK